MKKLSLTEATEQALKRQLSKHKKNRKLNESFNDEIKVYMNTWKNYNEYGADLEAYGIKDGWMSIDDAREFAELHADDEPFINDVDNCPIEVSEYDNCMQVFDDLEAIENCDNKDALIAIYEANSGDVQDALDIYDSGDFIFFEGIDDDKDLANAYIDMVGGLYNVANIEDYIDEDEYRDSWRDVAEESVRNNNPDLDENSDEFEAEVEDWLDVEYPEQLDLDIQNYSSSLENYFDYEAFGRDLSMDYTYTSTGAVCIL